MKYINPESGKIGVLKRKSPESESDRYFYASKMREIDSSHKITSDNFTSNGQSSSKKWALTSMSFDHLM